MANTLKFKRGLLAGLPTAAEGEPLFTTDTADLYIGTSTGNQRFQKYIASGATTQILRGDGSLYTFPLNISSPSNGQVLKYNGTAWVNDSDAGITGSGSSGQIAYFTGATTQAGNNNFFWDNTNVRLGIGTNTPAFTLDIQRTGLNILRLNGGTGTNQGSSIYIQNGNLCVGDSASFLGGTPNTNFGIYVPSAPLIFYIGATSERARITTNGNLIINNISVDTGEKLQVNGRTKIQNNSNAVLQVIQNQASLSNNAYALDVDSSAHTANMTSAGAFIVRVNSGTGLAVTGLGNVGIGNALASYRLDVVGSGIRTSPTPGSTGLWGSFVLGSSLDSTSQYFDAFRITGTGAGGYASNSTNVVFQVWNGSAWNTQMTINQGTGAVGIGTTGLTNYALRVSKNIVGGATSYGVAMDSTIQSTVGTSATAFFSNVATQAASFTLTEINNFYAVQGTFGAGSTVTNQYGFRAHAGLTGATNNYGFYSDIPAGTNRWNFFSNGTANSYFGGNVGIGSTSLTNRIFVISRTMTGTTDGYGIIQANTISSGVTSLAMNNYSQFTTQAATFTIADVYHYYHADISKGAGSTITNQYGYFAANIVAATNNFGFYGNISAGTGRWNLYCNGTAANYINGQLVFSPVGLTDFTASATTHPIIIGGARSATLSPMIKFTKYDFGTAEISLNYNNTFFTAGKTLEFATETRKLLELAVNNAGTIGLVRVTNANLLVGTVTSDTGELLQVNGTMKATGASTFSSTVTSTQYRLSALNTAPATSSSTGTLGEIRIDADHIYVCTATNTWKRVAIATF